MYDAKLSRTPYRALENRFDIRMYVCMYVYVVIIRRVRRGDIPTLNDT